MPPYISYQAYTIVLPHSTDRLAHNVNWFRIEGVASSMLCRVHRKEREVGASKSTVELVVGYQLLYLCECIDTLATVSASAIVGFNIPSPGP